MAIQAKVEATVIDIRRDKPKANDYLLIDTNVWFWFFYNRASLIMTARRQQLVQPYPAYLNNAVKAKTNLYWCGISLGELTHSIETTERDLFSTGYPSGITSKEFRHNLRKERATIVKRIQTVWTQVTGFAQPLDLTIDTATANAMLARLQTEQVDGYDYFLLEAMSRTGIKSIITDDIDYITVPGITVFTANLMALDLARRYKKLLSR